jgi:hypothetical protein
VGQAPPALRACSLVFVLAAAACSRAEASPLWRVEHDEVSGWGGGISATLDSDGALHVYGKTVRAPADQVARADALVRRLWADMAFLPSPPPDPCAQCSDAGHASTKVTFGSVRSWLSPLVGPDREQVIELEGILRKIGTDAAKKIADDDFRAEDHFTLGRVWLVEEDVRGDDTPALGTIESVWTRRGQTSTFDAVWDNGVTGEHGTDVIELTAKRRNNVVLDSRDGVRRYDGFYELKGDRHVKGSVYGGQSFDAEILDDALDASAGPLPVPAPYLSDARLHPRRTRRAVPGVPPEIPAPPSASPVPVATTLNDAVTVSSGGSGACAIRVGGAVVCWANSPNDPLLGVVPAPDPRTPRPIRFPAGAGAARDIAVGEDSACALLDDASVWCWGSSAYGVLGNGQTGATTQREPARVTRDDGAPLRAVAVSGKDWRVCAISTAGEVLCWGIAEAHPTPDAARPRLRFPHRFDPRTAVLRVNGTGCAMDAHELACWGRNVYGDLGTSDPDATLNEDLAPRIARAGAVLPLSQLTVGAGHACVVDARGSLWCWGANIAHQLGDDTYAPWVNARAVRFAAFPGVSPVTWIAGNGQTCAIGTAAARLFCTGGRSNAPRDDVATAQITRASGGSLTGVLRASLGGTFQCAIVSYPGAPAGAGQVACWGFRTGPMVPGECSLNGPQELCSIATPVAAPVP